MDEEVLSIGCAKKACILPESPVADKELNAQDFSENENTSIPHEVANYTLSGLSTEVVAKEDGLDNEAHATNDESYSENSPICPHSTHVLKHIIHHC